MPLTPARLVGSVALLLALAASPAAAQGDEKKADLKPSISISVEAEIPGAYRSRAITRVLDRDAEQGGEFFLAPEIAIRAVARLPKGVEVVTRIRNARLEADLHDSDTWGTDANRTVPGRSDAAASLDLAYLRINSLFWKELSLKAGLQDFSLSLRGPGDAFFAAPRRSEPALMSPVTESAAGGSLYGGAAPDGTTPATSGLFRDESAAAGLRVTWNAFSRSLLFVDAFWFTVLEGGVRHADERFYGVNADLLLPVVQDRPSLVNVLFAGIENDRTGSQIWTAGIGLDIVPAAPEGLDVWAEFYWQFGRYAEPSSHLVRQSAFAGRAGVKIPLDFLPGKPTVEPSFWIITGDDGNPARHLNRDFVSYENINEALIVEDALYGLDIDSNTISGRIRATARARILSNDDLRFDFLYAYFLLYREPDRAGGAKTDPGRRLGHEIDLRVTFDVTEQLSFSVFAGALLDSQWLAASGAYDTHSRNAFLGGLQVSVGF